jgi:hypothetical protein
MASPTPMPVRKWVAKRNARTREGVVTVVEWTGIDWYQWTASVCCFRRARSARWARYRSRPPLRANSRDTVDAARPSRPAMARSDSPAAIPLEISSRSVRDRCRSARWRGAGRTPPASSKILRIDDPFLPSRRAIDRVGSPAPLRSHTSAISASVNPLDTAHLPARHHNSRRWCCVHALRRQAIWAAQRSGPVAHMCRYGWVGVIPY